MSMHAASIAKLQLMKADPANHYFLDGIKHSIRKNQQKIAKSIYNLDSRNIKEFTHEWLAFRRKMKSEQIESPKQRTEAKRRRFGRTLRYEENETLEFQHDKEIKFEKHSYREDPATVAVALEGADSKSSVNFKKSYKNRLSVRVNEPNRKSREKLQPLREKSQSLIRQRKLTQRKRIATQWDLNRDKMNGSQLSNNRYDRSPESNEKYAVEQSIMEMSKQKMDRFVRNLHRLEWIYDFMKDKEGKDKQVEDTKEYKEHMRRFRFDQDCPINEAAINYMISKRYELLSHHLEDVYETNSKKLDEDATSMKRTKLAQGQDYELLNSLSKYSILNLINKQNVEEKKKTHHSAIYLTETQEKMGQVSFSLPFAQFISFRETKASIYRLTRMNIKTCFKIAFTIFDKNRNGKIDENDLLQMISLSRKLTMLEADIIVISKAMLASRDMRSYKKSSVNRSKMRIKTDKDQGEINSAVTNRSRQRTMSKDSDAGASFSPIKEEEYSESQNDNGENPLSSSRFSLEKLYTFLKDKQHHSHGRSKSKQDYRPIESLNFTSFCLAFKSKRPAIIYDLLQYIFAASKQDLVESVQQQISNPSRLNFSTSKKINLGQSEETLEQKWNKRLKNTNAILASLVKSQEKL